MKKKKRPLWKYAALLALVAAFGVGIWYYLAANSEQPTYDYLKATRGPLRVTLRESAVVQPEHRLNVTPPIPGRIDSVNVANGVAVKQGQVLAWISSTDRAALMDAARAAGGKEIDFWKDVYRPAPLIAPLDGHIISTAVVPGQVVVARPRPSSPCRTTSSSRPMSMRPTSTMCTSARRRRSPSTASPT